MLQGDVRDDIRMTEIVVTLKNFLTFFDKPPHANNPMG
jgi:hypothetical protein